MGSKISLNAEEEVITNYERDEENPTIKKEILWTANFIAAEVARQKEQKQMGNGDGVDKEQILWTATMVAAEVARREEQNTMENEDRMFLRLSWIILSISSIILPTMVYAIDILIWDGWRGFTHEDVAICLSYLFSILLFLLLKRFEEKKCLWVTMLTASIVAIPLVLYLVCASIWSGWSVGYHPGLYLSLAYILSMFVFMVLGRFGTLVLGKAEKSRSSVSAKLLVFTGSVTVFAALCIICCILLSGSYMVNFSQGGIDLPKIATFQFLVWGIICAIFSIIMNFVL